MKTVSMTEYFLLTLKRIELRELAIGLAVLSLLLLVVQLLEIGLKGLLLLGLLFAAYSILAWVAQFLLQGCMRGANREAW